LLILPALNGNQGVMGYVKPAMDAVKERESWL